jgi:phosphatidylserine decarboxylase
MSKSLLEWVESDVRPYQDRPARWLAETHCFRDPSRPTYSDTSYFFSPADGIIVYQKRARPDEPVVDIKGKSYTLRDALREPKYDKESLVIGVFMTFFDVHVNRVPYTGRLSYKELDPIDTFNHPMLDVEKSILDELRVDVDAMGYLHYNQRVVNRVFSDLLQQSYYILQIADYDVDCITPFELKQGRTHFQGDRFSQIRYGSQVDLIVPLSNRYEFVTMQETAAHVEAGIDPLIEIVEKNTLGVEKKTPGKDCGHVHDVTN